MAAEILSPFEPYFCSSFRIAVIIQVNGKIRCRIKMPAAASKEEVEKTALSAPELAPFITGKTVRKVIVVKNVVNVVAN